MPTILLTHGAEERRTRFNDEAFAALSALGDVRVNDSGAVLSTDRLVALAQGCRAVVCDRLTPAEARFFANAPDLVALCRSAVDIRNIDLDAATAQGVLVTHAGPAFIDAVAELILGMMIDLARGLSDAVLDYRAGREPEAQMRVQLAGSTLGVIGYGSIGRRVAALGQACAMRVLVDDPYVPVDTPGLKSCEFNTLLAESDFVVCLAIANDETDNLMDAAAFARMKPSAYFVNASRGSLVDEAALERALVEGQIAGAGLDVGLAPGQMPPPTLTRLPNVIATPHVGGLTRQAVGAQALETVAQLGEILAGRVPQGALNADRASRFHAGLKQAGD